jgi:hypothetical protein
MLSFKTIQTYLAIGGKTFHAKEVIKRLGGKWDPVMNMWLVPADLDNDTFRKSLQHKASIAENTAKLNEKMKRAAAKSPSGIAEANAKAKALVLKCLEMKKKTGAYSWICCEDCIVIDWRRQTTSCTTCGYTFRARGMVYTGD